MIFFYCLDYLNTYIDRERPAVWLIIAYILFDVSFSTERAFFFLDLLEIVLIRIIHM
jgi:hypothetical protein